MKKTFIFLLFIIVSCNTETKPNKNKYNNNDNQVAAVVNNEKIFINEIDKNIEQELFDELYHIYILRKISLKEIISEHILKQESIKQNKPVSKLLNENVERKITETGLKKFIKLNNLEHGIPNIRNGYHIVPLDSKEGENLINKQFKEYLYNKYIDSLKNNYNIEVLLKPVYAPIVSLNDISFYYRGNENSKVTLFEISDFECSACRGISSKYKQLYEKYKDKVKFAYINFSSEVNSAAIAAECAAKQGKFWEMHDLIFSSKPIFDKNGYYNLAKQLNLNIDKFKQDYKDTIVYNKLKKNIAKLNEKKFYGTPTIVINGKIVLDSFSIKEIEEIINEDLKKK